MRKPKSGRIRAGIGGWTYEPWRGDFYPSGLPRAKELAHASRQVTSIEVNATYYGTQERATFRRWAAETPDDFVFSLKASRFATNRRDLADAEPAIDRFVESGITELGAKLGPILWQFAPKKLFRAEEIARFVASLPGQVEGLALRHVLEARNASFQCADFVAIAREHKVAICLSHTPDYPLITDQTADFAYMRLQTSSDGEPAGYDAAAMTGFVGDAKTLAAGQSLVAPPLLAPVTRRAPRDCFVYFIGGAKQRNPAAALAFLAALT